MGYERSNHGKSSWFFYVTRSSIFANFIINCRASDLTHKLSSRAGDLGIKISLPLDTTWTISKKFGGCIEKTFIQ